MAYTEKLPVKVLLLNNQHLGMVVQWEDRFHGGNRAHTYLGAGHDPDNNTDPTAPYAFGYALRGTDNRYYKDVMAYGSDTALPFFSTPKFSYKGVAMVLGLKLKGFPAWFLHRSYHLLMMPTMGKKVRIAFDWTVGLFFPQDVVQLGSLQSPHEPFERAAED